MMSKINFRNPKVLLSMIMIGTFLSKILGLIRDMVLAQQYGTTLISDSYIIATTIPTILVGALAEAILTSYIPILNEVEKKEGSADHFNANIFSFSIVLVTIFLIIFFLFSEPIVRLFALGFTGEQLQVVVDMSDKTIFMSYFLVIISLLSGFLQNRGKFTATSFYGLIFNIVSIAGIIISAKSGNYNIMAFSFILGYGLSTLLLIFNSKKAGFKFAFVLDFKDKYLKKMAILTLPVILNSIVSEVNVVVSKTLTTFFGTGYVSALNYSNKIINVATGIIVIAIVTYTFPKMSSHHQNEDHEKLTTQMQNSMRIVSLLLVPIVFIFIFMAQDIIRILFMRGSFDEEALNITTICLQLYSFTLLSDGFNVIVYKYFNAKQLNKIPAFNAVISISLNIVFSLAFYNIFGFKGIIISAALASLIATILILLQLRKDNKMFDFKKLIKELIIFILAASISTFALYVFNQTIAISNLYLNFLVECGLFFAIYVVILMICKINIFKLKI